MTLSAVSPVAIPTVSLALFEYSRAKKTLQCSASTFDPGRAESFRVTSPRTGNTVTFVPDLDDMLAHEFYDGEARSYKPVQDTAAVIRLFITNW